MSGSKKKLSQDKLIELFYKIPFFKSFSAEEKIKFANIDTHVIYFDKGEYIISEGETGQFLYILLKGSVYITKNITPSLKVVILKPGAAFGEISFLAEAPRTTNVIANSAVIVLRLNKVILARLGAKLEIKVRDKLMRILIAKLDKMNRVLIDLVRFVPEADRKHLK